MTDLPPESVQSADDVTISVLNPINYVQVLRWLIFDTNRVRDLKDSKPLRSIAMRLTGLFVWLPVFLVVVARAANVIPTPETLFSPWNAVFGVIAAYVVSTVYIPDSSRAQAIRTAALIASILMAVGITIGIRVPGGFFEIASREQTALFGVAVGGGFAMGFAFALLFVDSNPIRPVAAVFVLILGLVGQAQVNIILLISLGVGVIMALAVYPIQQKEPQRLQNQNLPLRVMYALLILLSNLALVRLIFFT